MFLIDTVTLSELRRRQRDPVVVAWFERQRTSNLFLSVISIGEIERGGARAIQALPARLRLGWTGCWLSTASGSCHSSCERRGAGAP
jgi:predicted nucleic acid-binding protein